MFVVINLFDILVLCSTDITERVEENRRQIVTCRGILIFLINAQWLLM